MSTGHIGRFTDSRHDLGSVRPSRWVDQPAVRHRACLFVAAKADDAEDCRELLAMLGLTPDRRAAVEQNTPGNTVT